MNNVKRFWTLLALSAGLVSTSAEAKKPGGDGVPVVVTVLDEQEAPIPTAIVRAPEEEDRHRVNTMTGSWEGSVLYLPDGSEMVFTPGMSIVLEVSAPGYVTQVVQYDIRKRKNKIQVTLQKLVLDESDIEEPLIQFGRDRPREN